MADDELPLRETEPCFSDPISSILRREESQWEGSLSRVHICSGGHALRVDSREIRSLLVSCATVAVGDSSAPISLSMSRVLFIARVFITLTRLDVRLPDFKLPPISIIVSLVMLSSLHT